MTTEKRDRIQQLFDLRGRVAIVTGGAGLLGYHHGAILGNAGSRVVLLDLPVACPDARAAQLTAENGIEAIGLSCDITSEASLENARKEVLEKFERIDILVNNAANNPKVESGTTAWSRLENFPLETWDLDIRVGLTGAFLCSRIFGSEMAKQASGVIVNVASDFALIGPNQMLYRLDGVPEDQQPVKPVSYPVVKAGMLGLTRYLATYWKDQNVRVNSLCPGGVFNGQPDEFVQRIEELIPMGRMAERDEYQGAILFLCSDASTYMTGATLVVDGGRTCW